MNNSLRKSLLILIMFLSLFLVSCSTTVGDSCEKEGDCDTGLTCDENFPGGYCLKANCSIYLEDSCSDNAQCTYFKDTESTYCLAKCNSNDDCRSQYTCQAVPNNKYRVCLPAEN